MAHGRFRRLDMLLIGADPARLAARRQQPAVHINVQWGTRGRFRASSGQVKALIEKTQGQGGSIEAQDVWTGEWATIRGYKVKRSVAHAQNAATGEWFEVAEIREVL